MAERRTLYGGQPPRGVGGHPLPRTPRRRTMGLWTAGGCASRRSARSGSRHWSTSSSSAGSSRRDADHGLAWPLLGVLPMFVFGMWLLTVSSSRTAVLIALAATAMLVGSAYETFVQRNIEMHAEPWFPLFNMIGLTADAVGDVRAPDRVRHVPRRGARAAVAAHRGRVPLGAGARRARSRCSRPRTS